MASAEEPDGRPCVPLPFPVPVSATLHLVPCSPFTGPVHPCLSEGAETYPTCPMPWGAWRVPGETVTIAGWTGPQETGIWLPTELPGGLIVQGLVPQLTQRRGTGAGRGPTPPAFLTSWLRWRKEPQLPTSPRPLLSSMPGPPQQATGPGTPDPKAPFWVAGALKPELEEGVGAPCLPPPLSSTSLALPLPVGACSRG